MLTRYCGCWASEGRTALSSVGGAVGTLFGRRRGFRSRVGPGTSWASPQAEVPLGTRPAGARWPSSGSQSRNGEGVGEGELGPGPPATELVPEAREGHRWRWGWEQAGPFGLAQVPLAELTSETRTLLWTADQPRCGAEVSRSM